MQEKTYTVGQLKVIFQNDLKEFVRLLIFHKKNNISYFNRILLPFYREQKNLYKIPKTVTDFIEEHELATVQIEINPIKNIQKENNYIKEKANTYTKQNVGNDTINNSEYIECEKKTSEELYLIARSDFKLFKTLSASYYEQDKKYYESVVLPILNYHQKRSLEKDYNKARMEEKINKAHNKILVYGGIISFIMFLILYGYFYINNKFEEADNINKANEERLRKEFEEKNEKTKRETEQKIIDEYTQREERNRQKILEEERKKEIEKGKSKTISKDGWEYVATTKDGDEYYITEFNKTTVGANVWVKRICNRDCGVYQGSSITSIATLCQYNFKTNTCVPSIGHLYLSDGRDITQYNYAEHEERITTGTIGDVIIKKLKNMR